jgi:hypothetical protein
LRIVTAVRESGILADLRRDGFGVRRDCAIHLSTIEAAQTLGTPINVQTILPGSGITTVQSLRPKNVSEVGRNQYSGHYGFGVFPLHTDLAHWAVPPRYLFLRCVVGSDDVFTHILSSAPIVDLLGSATLRKALFTARRRRMGSSGLVRAMSYHGEDQIFRWDPIFLAPLNESARVFASTILDPHWANIVVKVLLQRPGDTMIIDNWHMLHGRGSVLPTSRGRRIERVYLSEVRQ